jgi:hypothetical protein
LRPERYALVADESGNAREPLRILAGLSGPSRRLAALERSLRSVLRRHGLREVKWAGLRTKKNRLQAAREFLALALSEAAAGHLGLDLLVFEEGFASRSWEGLDDLERWLALYRLLISKAKKRRPKAAWTLYPDQRTGMPWRRLGRVVESSSGRLALVQLADLLAGLSRFSRGAQGAAHRARANRRELLEDFLGMVEAMGLRRSRAVVFWQVRNLRGAARGKAVRP